MGISLATIKQEIKELTERKEDIEQKIKALQALQGAYHTKQGKSVATRNGVDIKPFITEIFEKNSNQPMRKKEIVMEVAKMSGFTKDVIDSKLIIVLRKGLLEKAGEYGKYRLRQKENA